MLILRAAHSVDDPGERYHVTQKVSARVWIVQLDDDVTKEELQMLDGVAAVLEPGEGLADDVRGKLTNSELIFVDAYALRSRPKQRLGEGLDWDAEGFLPPDTPG